MQGSKSIAKRKAEVAEAAAHDKEAKRLRLEMKQRGHVVRHFINWSFNFVVFKLLVARW